MNCEYLSAFAILYFLLNIIGVTCNTFGSKILFYNGSTNSTFTTHNLMTAESVVQDMNFDTKKTTIIFIHGWLQSPFKPTVQTLVNAYLKNGNYNIFIVDWSQVAASYDFVAVSDRVNELGREISLWLGRMKPLGVSCSKIHIVGHSLGACMASSIGKYTQQTGNKIARITGLDPANLYLPSLVSSDAFFVDIIHTNRGFMGTLVNSGTVQFYPNMGGPIQPGCPIIALTMEKIACSHLRSIDLWSESVRMNVNTNFLSTNVRSNIPIQMGNNCPVTARWKYYLTTNKQSLYSKT